MNIAIRSAVLATLLIAGTAAAQGTTVVSSGPDSTAVRQQPPLPREIVIDSVALERTTCFGACPAYRVTITRAGDVRFESRNYGAAGWAGEGQVDPSEFRSLMNMIFFGSLLDLPDTIETDVKYCPMAPTDQPNAIVTIYNRHRTKTVVDYLGCAWAPSALRRFEEAIDKTAGSKQWARPNDAPR